jgi:hypothetical protein
MQKKLRPGNVAPDWINFVFACDSSVILCRARNRRCIFSGMNQIGVVDSGPNLYPARSNETVFATQCVGAALLGKLYI